MKFVVEGKYFAEVNKQIGTAIQRTGSWVMQSLIENEIIAGQVLKHG